MKDRFKLSLVDCGETFAVFLYDLVEQKVVWEITDYADALIKKLHFKRTSIQQEIGYLRVFWAHLMATGVNFVSISDETLIDFKKRSLRSAIDSPSYRGGRDDSVHATVNAKLVRVYDWLYWLQETGHVPLGTIGYRNSRVQSALQGSSLSREAKANKNFRSVHKYPLLFDVRTSKSKHSIAKFIPTEETVDFLHEYFFTANGTSYTRHRNALLVDVAAYTGFRRNSIQSLHIDQFIGASFVATDRDTVIIKPARQKFGYGDTYEIPFILHDQIRRFVLTHRLDLLASKKLAPKITEGAVFISERTCQPLDDRSITAIVSKALRACGAPKGTAIHSFRAKFLVEATAQEYEERKELGLDTSEDTISRAVALKVGHKNVKSARPYIASHAAREIARSQADKMRRAKEMKDENSRLREENQLLKSMLRTDDKH